MPKIILRPQWAALLCLLLTFGCKSELPDPSTIGTAPAVTHTGAPLTEEDGRAFGNQLEQAVAAGDTAEVEDLLRLNAMLERSVSDLGLSTNEKKGLQRASGLSSRFTGEVIKVVQAGGSYSLLRVRTVAGRPRVIMRLIHSEGAINYHEFSLARYPDEQIATEDFYIYATGEPFSQTLRRLILSFMIGHNKGVSKLKSEEQLLFRHLPDITKMTEMAQRGESREALEIFRMLPAELQKNKFLQIIAIQAAGGTGDDNEYITEMERFRKHHPKDVALDFISIDYYLLKKDYDEALNSMARLDESLGGDPYLNVLRASSIIEAGRLQEAREFVEQAIKDDPTLSQAYWTKAYIAAKEKNHSDTLQCFKLIVEKFGEPLDPDALATDERFAEFAETPQFEEFKKWLARRAE